LRGYRARQSGYLQVEAFRARSIQLVRVDLDQVPVRIENIELRIAGSRVRHRLHLHQVAFLRILAIAPRMEEFHYRAIVFKRGGAPGPRFCVLSGQSTNGAERFDKP
jgi:hypothetical protein